MIERNRKSFLYKIKIIIKNKIPKITKKHLSFFAFLTDKCYFCNLNAYIEEKIKPLITCIPSSKIVEFNL